MALVLPRNVGKIFSRMDIYIWQIMQTFIDFVFLAQPISDMDARIYELCLPCTRVRFSKLTGHLLQIHGLVSISSCRKISQNLYSACSVFRVFQSLWHLAGLLTAVLPRRLWHFTVIAALWLNLVVSRLCEIVRWGVLSNIETRPWAFIPGEAKRLIVASLSTHIW